MKPLRYLEAAQWELTEATTFLEGRADGLGRRLHEEIRGAEESITRFPFAATEVRPSIRRYMLRKFPYGLIYTVTGDEIVVLAVSHLRRAPHYWIGRSY